MYRPAAHQRSWALPGQMPDQARSHLAYTRSTGHGSVLPSTSPAHFDRKRAKTTMAKQQPETHGTPSLLIAVEHLARVQDRFDTQESDPTGTSAGDDGENRDGLNHPEA